MIQLLFSHCISYSFLWLLLLSWVGLSFYTPSTVNVILNKYIILMLGLREKFQAKNASLGLLKKHRAGLINGSLFWKARTKFQKHLLYVRQSWPFDWSWSIRGNLIYNPSQYLKLKVRDISSGVSYLFGLKTLEILSLHICSIANNSVIWQWYLSRQRREDCYICQFSDFTSVVNLLTPVLHLRIMSTCLTDSIIVTAHYQLSLHR
jgi:hypothetical protein